MLTYKSIREALLWLKLKLWRGSREMKLGALLVTSYALSHYSFETTLGAVCVLITLLLAEPVIDRTILALDKYHRKDS